MRPPPFCLKTRHGRHLRPTLPCPPPVSLTLSRLPISCFLQTHLKPSFYWFLEDTCPRIFSQCHLSASLPRPPPPPAVLSPGFSLLTGTQLPAPRTASLPRLLRLATSLRRAKLCPPPLSHSYQPGLTFAALPAAIHGPCGLPCGGRGLVFARLAGLGARAPCLSAAARTLPSCVCSRRVGPFPSYTTYVFHPSGYPPFFCR